MANAKKKQIALMSESQQLQHLKASCLSLAGRIQGYQDSLLKMISDREEVVDYMEIDGDSIRFVIEAFEMDLFIAGHENCPKLKAARAGSFKAHFIGNDKVTGAVGSKPYGKKRGRATTGQRGGRQA